MDLARGSHLPYLYKDKIVSDFPAISPYMNTSYLFFVFHQFETILKSLYLCHR